VNYLERVDTLVLVHRQQLLERSVARLGAFLDIGSDRIGVLRGARKRPTGVLDVATIQSLVRKGEVADAGYGHLVADECHHLFAVSFEAVARAVRAKYVLGLSATVTRKDGHQISSHDTMIMANVIRDGEWLGT
jgi:superfamily II DNA or RNA helicase